MQKMICFVSSMDAGGAETFLMKLYRKIDKTKYQMDFIVNIKTSGFYDNEIKLLGGKIFYTPPKSKCLISNIYQNYKIIKNGGYVAALRMTSHSLGTIDLLVAKFAGIKKLILRSTNAGSSSGITSYILHRLFLFLPILVPTIKIAPSSQAAEYLFGKTLVKKGMIEIVHNGLPLDKFIFSEKKRQIKRKELGINGNFVIGHIGRFDIQKNHQFLINVFRRIHEREKDAKLLLIGKGELQEQIKKQVTNLGLSGSVYFLGIRRDIPELLMAMDVLVFPSFFEGMPNTVIEAQAAGLSSVISDKITKEVLITDLVEILNLEDKEDCWARKVLKLKSKTHKNTISDMKRAGYDINDIVLRFEEFFRMG